jgi:hypothetical protein
MVEDGKETESIVLVLRGMLELNGPCYQITRFHLLEHCLLHHRAYMQPLSRAEKKWHPSVEKKFHKPKNSAQCCQDTTNDIKH